MGNMRFKVGDRVKIQSLEQYNKHKNRHGDINYGCETEILFTPEMSSFCGRVVTITRVRYIGCVRFYHLAEDKGDHLWVDGMFEGLAEEETLIERVDDNGLPFNEWLSHKGAFHVPDGYELKNENGNVINATKIVLEKKKKEYPKTYEECCKVLGMTFDYPDIRMVSTEEFKLYSKFIQLKRCRDAHWKLYGKEMGLGKPWSPDYDSGVNKYGIICMNGVIQKSNPTTNWERHLNKVLDFPTPEMRDAFYENFTEEIEICKELL